MKIRSKPGASRMALCCLQSMQRLFHRLLSHASRGRNGLLLSLGRHSHR